MLQHENKKMNNEVGNTPLFLQECLPAQRIVLYDDVNVDFHSESQLSILW